MQETLEQPLLDKPGAGLPFPEAQVLRYFIFPLACLNTDDAKATRNFRATGNAILKIGREISEESFVTPVLIKRGRGIEDSSRFWSAEMVIEHLILVGGRFRIIMESLDMGVKVPFKVDPAKVKPKGGRGVKILGEFEHFLNETEKYLETGIKNPNSSATCSHPWFGNLKLRQWRVLIGGHQKVHLNQMLEIVKGLS